MRISLAGIIIFGIIRALAYKTHEWNNAAGQSQVTMLIVKHIIFAGIFVPGVVLYMKAIRIIKRVRDEQTQ